MTKYSQNQNIIQMVQKVIPQMQQIATLIPTVAPLVNKIQQEMNVLYSQNNNENNTTIEQNETIPAENNKLQEEPIKIAKSNKFKDITAQVSQQNIVQIYNSLSNFNFKQLWFNIQNIVLYMEKYPELEILKNTFIAFTNEVSKEVNLISNAVSSQRIKFLAA
jgi:hypothetical protein